MKEDIYMVKNTLALHEVVMQVDIGDVGKGRLTRRCREK